MTFRFGRYFLLANFLLANLSHKTPKRVKNPVTMRALNYRARKYETSLAAKTSVIYGHCRYI